MPMSEAGATGKDEKIEIRVAESSELGEIRNVFFRATPPEYRRRSIMYSPWMYQVYYRQLMLRMRARIYCAVAGGRIRGFCIMRKRDDGWLLAGVFLEPEYRNKNVGEKLLTVALPKHRPCHVYVEANNEPALKLYSKFSPKMIGKRYYALISKARIRALMEKIPLPDDGAAREKVYIFPVNDAVLGVRCTKLSNCVFCKLSNVARINPFMKYAAVYIEGAEPPPELREIFEEEYHLLMRGGE